MKTLILIPTLFILVLSGYSQTFQDFPNSGDSPVWKQINTFLDYEGSLNYGMHGDTIIESEIYQKLYYLTDTIFNINKAGYYAAIQNRADTVFIIYSNSVKKCLLFVFSANENDTIWMKSNYKCRAEEFPIDFVVIDSTDTITINGNKHKVLYVNDGFHRTTWIEGIGNNGEIFCPITVYTDNGFLNSGISCFKRNENIYYPSADSDCFDYPTGIAEEKNDTHIEIYPNPGNTILTISCDPVARISKIEIYNSIGEIFKTLRYNTIGDVQVPIGELPNGIYFIKITDYSDSITSIKFLKR